MPPFLARPFQFVNLQLLNIETQPLSLTIANKLTLRQEQNATILGLPNP